MRAGSGKEISGEHWRRQRGWPKEMSKGLGIYTVKVVDVKILEERVRRWFRIWEV